MLDIHEIGRQCDLGLVVGGDGTMLGFGRQLAQYGVPLIGINQGRLGFITDIPLEGFAQTLKPMLQGEFEEDRRPLMHGQVWRDGHCVFDAMALNDVVMIFAFAPLVAFLLVRNLTRSRVGRSLVAIRDNETAAEVAGVRVDQRVRAAVV